MGLALYDFGTMKDDLSNKFSDDEKYKVLNNLDQPMHYNFPSISDGKQMRKFQSAWFSKYSWLTENGATVPIV